MKPMHLIALLISLLNVSCTSKTAPPKPLGLANPASQYCIQQGGTLHIESSEAGQIGVCHLPTGEIIEEWALFRAHLSTEQSH